MMACYYLFEAICDNKLHHILPLHHSDTAINDKALC